MRILLLTLTLLAIFTTAQSQDIKFTYQSGLTSPVHRIIPIPESNTYIIAERNGGLLTWDITTNKILFKLTTASTEIADVAYSSKNKRIFVAGEKGIELFDASKLLTDHIIQPDHHYRKGRITALFWNESKDMLRATSGDGQLLAFSGLSAFRNNKPTAIIPIGIPDIFAIREMSDRICVLGRQKQAFFTLTGKPVFSANNNTTGLYGYAFHEKDSAIYIAHESEIVRLRYTSNRFNTTRISTGIKEHGALVQGISLKPETGEVFAGTNRNSILAVSKNSTATREVFNSPDGSFTGLLIHNGKLLAGDFFGNVLVIEPGIWKKLFQLNEDLTPSLNGVFLDRNTMVSTHFGLRGSAVKIWDLRSASLVNSFNVRSDIAYDIAFSPSGDTIYSAHTDDAIYQYYGDAGQYRMDTLQSPSRPFMYGSIFFNVQLDKKSTREKNTKAFTSMLAEPGMHVFPADTANSTEIVFVNSLEIPEECVQGKLPSNYRIPEAYLAAAGLVTESSGWDMLDKDVYYMRACSSPTLQMFLERVAEKGIDTAKSAHFYRIIKGAESVPPFFYINSVADSRTLRAFVRKQKPLYADISRMPEMAIFFYSDSLVVWNGKTGRTTSFYTGFADMDFYYDFNDRYVAIADERSGSISLFSLTHQEKSAATKWFSFGEEEYLIHNKEGYYKVRGRSNRINFSIDSKPLSFQSFDLKYNRPDLVMEDVGAGDTILISAYRAAALKRVRRSGMNITQPGSSMPVLDFVDRDSLSYQQENDQLHLRIKGESEEYIDRINIWINEVPAFGSNGYSIRALNTKTIDTTLDIVLSQGENHIETSLITETGVESLRTPLRVNFTGIARIPGKLYFIGIGIDSFSNSKYNLRYSVKDIRDLSIALKEKYGNNISIDTFFNEQFTTGKIIALKEKLNATGINDKVIISYSGHGLLSKEFDYYLSTYFVNFENPEEKGLPYYALENLMDSIPARRKLILIDACHSGEVDKDDLVMLNEINDPQVKGLKPVQHKQPGQLGLKNSFELMQDLFINVGKSTGATVISAAAGTQFALERNDLQNGVFTYSILEAMKNNAGMKVSDLRKIVSERVVQLTNGRQVPTARSETISVDWNVW